MTVVLSGSDLTVTQVIAVARHGEAVELADTARKSMQDARGIVTEG
jgi:histidine ammonia-lyase